MYKSDKTNDIMINSNNAITYCLNKKNVWFKILILGSKLKFKKNLFKGPLIKFLPILLIISKFTLILKITVIQILNVYYLT